MGQRSAIFMFLLGGGAILPVVILGIIAGLLGRSAMLMAIFVQVLGFASIVFAKWPELAAGRIFSFGPKSLSTRGRLFYWSGYALIGCGFILAVASLRFA